MMRALVLVMLSAAYPVWAADAPVAAAAPPVASSGNLLQVLLGLIVVMALMGGIVWMLRRMGIARSPAGSVAKIVGGLSVGNRERVLVVEVADQWIVVGVAPGRVSALASLPRQELPQTSQSLVRPGSDAQNFASWLKQTIEKRNAR